MALVCFLLLCFADLNILHSLNGSQNLSGYLESYHIHSDEHTIFAYILCTFRTRPPGKRPECYFNVF